MLDKISSYNYIIKKNVNANPCTSSFVAEKPINLEGFKSIYMPGGVSFKGIPALTKNYLSEISRSGVYRAKLANAIGTTVEKLKSVLEPGELKEILRNATPEEFSNGENFENVLNGTYRINLHMHTNNSDGVMSVKQLLEQAANYANYRKSVFNNNPVIVAITDHDALDGAKEAIKIIAGEPEKYKNIRFVPGIEFNAQENSTQLEVVGYCINPFDEGLNKFLEANRTKNKKYLEAFLKDSVNKWEASANIPDGEKITLEKLKRQADEKDITCGRHLKYIGSPGIMMGFTNALKSIFYERGWKFDGIDKFSHEHGLKYKNFGIMPGTPTIQEISNAVHASQNGFVGIAHPCRNLKGINLEQFFQNAKRYGVDAVESNYQYPKDERYSKTFQESAESAAKQTKMLNTGGGDNHTDNIITNLMNFDYMPEDIQLVLSDSDMANKYSNLALAI